MACDQQTEFISDCWVLRLVDMALRTFLPYSSGLRSYQTLQVCRSGQSAEACSISRSNSGLSSSSLQGSVNSSRSWFLEVDCAVCYSASGNPKSRRHGDLFSNFFWQQPVIILKKGNCSVSFEGFPGSRLTFPGFLFLSHCKFIRTSKRAGCVRAVVLSFAVVF